MPRDCIGKKWGSNLILVGDGATVVISGAESDVMSSKTMRLPGGDEGRLHAGRVARTVVGCRARGADGVYVIATATSVEGAPTIAPDSPLAAKWKIETTATDVKLRYVPSGMFLLFR